MRFSVMLLALIGLSSAVRGDLMPPSLPSQVDASKFRVTVFAQGLNYPTSMQQLSDGSILVGTSDPVAGNFFNSTGTLRRLVDANGDGVADNPNGTVLYSGLPGTVTSVRQAGDLLFVTSAQPGNEQITVLRAGAQPADAYTSVGDIRFNFSSGWAHTSYALAVRDTPGSPGDHDVFFNVGSKVNAATTTDTVPVSGLVSGTLNADSIYKFTVHDGGGTPTFSGLAQVATGLRNAAGMAFQPGTGDLYFQDNGIDGLTDPNKPLSVDELNRLHAAAIGGPVQDFGFAHDYITYGTGVRVGSGAVQPLATFQPDPMTGSEKTGATELAFTPAGFVAAGMDPGVFIGFHGTFNAGGLANEKNPVVYYDLTTGQYYDFISNNEPTIGHIDGLLATGDSLFLSDLTSTGSLFFPGDQGQGAIYQIQAIRAVPEPGSAASLGLGGLILVGLLRRNWSKPTRA
jgi:glucose/arabinose dehydrogenase